MTVWGLKPESILAHAGAAFQEKNSRRGQGKDPGQASGFGFRGLTMRRRSYFGVISTWLSCQIFRR